MNPGALEDVDDEAIETAIPSRPIASLRDLEVLYGALYTLGWRFESDHAPYLTPGKADDQFGGENLITVRVDLRGDKAVLSELPVTREMLPKALVELVAHVKYDARNGIDHSITHQSGQTNGPSKHADHAFERLSRWPTDDAVKSIAGEHEDGWVIDILAELAESDDIEAAIRERVRELVHEEGQLLHTVQLAFDEGDLKTTSLYRPDEEWHYPGEVEVFQEAMAARKTRKFRTKNEAKDAVGDGTCFVFDTKEQVYGVVNDPMNHYLSKQMEQFPQLDAERSWQTQGLSHDAALRAQAAAPFLDACNVSAPGTSAYYLPYPPGKINADIAQRLYRLLAEQVESEDGSSPIGRRYHILKQVGKLDELRFYFVIVHKYQADRWRLLASSPNASARIPEDLSKKHQLALDGPWLNEDGPFPLREGFPLLAQPSVFEFTDVTSSVGYLAETCLGDDTDEPSTDDFRFQGTATLASGRSLDADTLLGEYVDQLSDRFDPDDEYPFPTAKLAEQYAQLSALAACGLLDAEDPRLEVPPEYMTDDTTQQAAPSRSERYEQFLDDHPGLSDERRCGVFSLGALVGRITRYQRREDKSMTAVKQYPIDNLTKHNITRIATEVVDSNVIYSDEENYTGTMFAELMDGVVDGLESSDPTDWSLSTDDLRFHYAMGIAYGLNDYSTSDYDNE